MSKGKQKDFSFVVWKGKIDGLVSWLSYKTLIIRLTIQLVTHLEMCYDNIELWFRENYEKEETFWDRYENRAIVLPGRLQWCLCPLGICSLSLWLPIVHPSCIFYGSVPSAFQTGKRWVYSSNCHLVLFLTGMVSGIDCSSGCLLDCPLSLAYPLPSTVYVSVPWAALLGSLR